MDVGRLNSEDRLSGKAILKGTAITVEKYDLVFNVWSKSNNCAAANLQTQGQNSICGILFEIPDEFIYRRKDGIKTLDSIEGEGKNYQRENINVIYQLKNVTAITYIGKELKSGIITSFDYAKHLVNGAIANNFADEYTMYIISQIIKSNPEINNNIREYVEAIKKTVLKKFN
jgi:hypothetical protein